MSDDETSDDDAPGQEKPQQAAPARRSPGGAPRSKAQILQFMQEVEVMMMYGQSRSAILASLATRGVSKRTADKYMKDVRDRWIAEREATQETRRERQLNRLYAQIRLLQTGQRLPDGTMVPVKMRNHSEIVKRERLIAQIEGNLAPQQVEHTIRKRKFDDLTPEQLKHIAETGELPPDVKREELDE